MTRTTRPPTPQPAHICGHGLWWALWVAAIALLVLTAALAELSTVDGRYVSADALRFTIQTRTLSLLAAAAAAGLAILVVRDISTRQREKATRSPWSQRGRGSR